MKRSLSAPCLAEESDSGSKKSKGEKESDEPTGREYLQLALARVMELQRQVKDETYTTDATSDLGESDSEDDVMREVLTKVFKDLPGSSASLASIINRATRREHPSISLITEKRIRLSGYDTCRKIALDFMNTVVRSTPMKERDPEAVRFERGSYSMIEGKTAARKTGLRSDNPVDKYEPPAGRDGLNEAGNSTRNNNEASVVSRDYEIRVRMLKGLDLHLATKQRDFTARLMRQ